MLGRLMLLEPVNQSSGGFRWGWGCIPTGVYTHNAPKLAILRSKMEKKSGEGSQPPPQTLPRGEGDTPPGPSPHPTGGDQSVYCTRILCLRLRVASCGDVEWSRVLFIAHIPHRRFLDPPLNQTSKIFVLQKREHRHKKLKNK